VANPADGVGEQLRLSVSCEERQQTIKALNEAELERFLATAKRCSRLSDFYVVLVRTGLRLGEGLGLQEGDVNHETRSIRVERSLDKYGAVGKPKSGYGRDLDASREVLAVLRMRAVRK